MGQCLFLNQVLDPSGEVWALVRAEVSPWVTQVSLVVFESNEVIRLDGSFLVLRLPPYFEVTTFL
jgi:hypothetical protein